MVLITPDGFRRKWLRLEWLSNENSKSNKCNKCFPFWSLVILPGVCLANLGTVTFFLTTRAFEQAITTDQTTGGTLTFLTTRSRQTFSPYWSIRHGGFVERIDDCQCKIIFLVFFESRNLNKSCRLVASALKTKVKLCFSALASWLLYYFRIILYPPQSLSFSDQSFSTMRCDRKSRWPHDRAWILLVEFPDFEHNLRKASLEFFQNVCCKLLCDFRCDGESI